MLYVIGGVARTGKSIIAHRFMQDTGTPYLSLDILMMGLYRGFPEHDITPEDPDFQNADKMWPVVRNMCRNIAETGVEYLLEGVSIHPEHIHELYTNYSPDVKACFLGYPNTSAKDKLRSIREYSDYPNNWSTGYSDKELLDFIENQIKHSRYLQEECLKYDIHFFDQSEDFISSLDSVMNFFKG